MRWILIRSVCSGRQVTALLAAVLLLAGCGARDGEPGVLSATMPLHLEQHIDDATIVGSEIPTNASKRAEWRFDEPDSDWSPVAFPRPGATTLSRRDGRLIVDLGEKNRLPEQEGFIGAISIDLPGWERDEWAEIVIEARTDGVRFIAPYFNLQPRNHPVRGTPIPYQYEGEGTMALRDGQVHTYRLPADRSDPAFGEWEGPWNQLILGFWSPNPSTIELLSVSVITKASVFSDAPVGVRMVERGAAQRRAMFVHTPGRLDYTIRVPDRGRLDTGLGVLRSTMPVRFRVSVTPAGGTEEVLFEKTIDDAEAWVPATVDLSDHASQTVTLSLHTDSDHDAGVAFWSSPTVSGKRVTDKPNIIFYVIDGAGADLMSLYGYDRPTTPNLERLAAEAVVFEQARSNSAWTKPSTASFMTSLHQSVLGGFRSLQDPIPESVVPMAEHFHDAGYQTGVFTTNPFAGSMSNLQRGADHFQDGQLGRHNSESSVDLQAAFWEWRDQHPAEPYWAHFQTTDVHEPHRPVAPFAGMFVSPERRELFYEQWEQCAPFAVNFAQTMTVFKDPTRTLADFYRERLETIGADPKEFFETQRGLYDETMAHQDHQIGRLVEQLKARGEWENTLLVIASDHGHPAGSFSRFGRELLEPRPPDTEGALLDSYRTSIPLMFIWPGHIDGGQRLTEPVSMIDMLPTLLDLAGLAQPEVLQGQSLTPLMRGEPGWEPRPIILEQLQGVPDRGELVGHIEVIDGRWGASLEIWPESLEGDDTVRPVGQQRAARPHRPGMPKLMLYDLRNDPFVRQNVNDRHPELVEKYTSFLLEQLDAHRVLAGQFETTGAVDLSPEQLETLRSLGYVQ